jgi:hypothetical protein
MRDLFDFLSGNSASPSKQGDRKLRQGDFRGAIEDYKALPALR